MKLKNVVLTGMVAVLFTAPGCTSSGYSSSAVGGEVTGSSSAALREPIPYGMVLVKRGSLKIGEEANDSL